MSLGSHAVQHNEPKQACAVFSFFLNIFLCFASIPCLLLCFLRRLIGKYFTRWCLCICFAWRRVTSLLWWRVFKFFFLFSLSCLLKNDLFFLLSLSLSLSLPNTAMPQGPQIWERHLQKHKKKEKLKWHKYNRGLLSFSTEIYISNRNKNVNEDKKKESFMLYFNLLAKNNICLACVLHKSWGKDIC